MFATTPDLPILRAVRSAPHFEEGGLHILTGRGGVPPLRAPNVSVRTRGPPSKWRCRSCRRDVTVTTGTAQHGSKVALDKWVEGSRYPVTRPGEIAMHLALIVHGVGVCGGARPRKSLSDVG